MLDKLIARRALDVGIALRVGMRHRQNLNRIRLQKFIYLNDVASLIFANVPRKIAHRTYRYGPYDAAIQAAATSLVFRGFAREQATSVPQEGKVSSEFSLLPVGIEWVEGICVTRGPFADRLRSAEALGEFVNSVGWHKLKSLAYAEPTFASIRKQGWGQSIDSGNALSESAAKFLMLIRQVLERKGVPKPSAELQWAVFCRFLSEYAKQSDSAS